MRSNNNTGSHQVQFVLLEAFSVFVLTPFSPFPLYSPFKAFTAQKDSEMYNNMVMPGRAPCQFNLSRFDKSDTLWGQQLTTSRQEASLVRFSPSRFLLEVITLDQETDCKCVMFCWQHKAGEKQKLPLERHGKCNTMCFLLEAAMQQIKFHNDTRSLMPLARECGQRGKCWPAEGAFAEGASRPHGWKTHRVSHQSQEPLGDVFFILKLMY